ncbi:MAG: cobalamin-binding protein [Thermodesulfobacteriota bacterium]|jgi:iron complex transport system substrate-binding protein
MIRKSILLTLVLFLLHIPAQGQEGLFTDEIGRKVRIPNSPKRIVSMAPNLTEILFTLELREEIVGVTDFCDYPEAALTKHRIGGFVNPSIEKIVSLKPDLILGIRDGNRMDTVHRLSDLGFSVYVVDPMGFDGIIKTIENIGEVVRKREKSKEIIRKITKKKEAIVRLTQSLPRRKVFFQVGFSPIVTVGRGSLGDDLIRLAGGRSISENESGSYPVYGVETILSKAPEVIILSSMDSKRDYLNLMKMWQSWKELPAVKMNAIYVIDSNLVDRPTPRVVEGLEAMAGMIHPEISFHSSKQN